MPAALHEAAALNRLPAERIPVTLSNGRTYPLDVNRFDVPMTGLPPVYNGITVAHLSDFHGGYAHTENAIEEAIRRVNAEKPELILLTGDYIDHGIFTGDFPIDQYLRELSAPLGVLATFGNHDHRRTLPRVYPYLERAGIRPLHNENVTLAGGLTIAGLDDLEEGKPDVAKAMRGVDPQRTTIVLSHNPSMVEQMRDRDIVMLSGHTHGAQFCFPFPSPQLICWLHLRCRQVAGWYRVGQARLYVSRGLGVTRFPFRANCPAEVTFYRLTPQVGTLPGERV